MQAAQEHDLPARFDYALWMDSDNHLVADCCEDVLGTLVALRHGWAYTAGGSRSAPALNPSHNPSVKPDPVLQLIPHLQSLPLTRPARDHLQSTDAAWVGLAVTKRCSGSCRGCARCADHPLPCAAEEEFPYEGRNESQAFVPQSNRFQHYYYAGASP